MLLFEDLLRRTVGDLETELKRKLIAELYELGNTYVAPKVADLASRGILKSLDGVSWAAVRTLPKEDAARFVAGYLDEVLEQFEQFTEALRGYAPLSHAVNEARHEFGHKSAQANAARKARDKWTREVKSEARDIFKVVAGEEPVD